MLKPPCHSVDNAGNLSLPCSGWERIPDLIITGFMGEMQSHAERGNEANESNVERGNESNVERGNESNVDRGNESNVDRGNESNRPGPCRHTHYCSLAPMLCVGANACISFAA